MRKKSSGFSLVELLVVISIICILSVVGIASYINFSRSQTVTQAARKIVQDMRLAQSLANNGQKPTVEEGCVGNLSSYIFTRISDANLNCTSNYYCIFAYCVDGANKTFPKIKEVLVGSDITLTGLKKVEFLVLKRGAIIDGLESPSVGLRTLSVSMASTSVVKSVVVDEGGSIKISDEED